MDRQVEPALLLGRWHTDPEDEVDDVIRETPKVASRDAPGG